MTSKGILFNFLWGCSGLLRGCSGVPSAALEGHAPRVLAAPAPPAAAATTGDTACSLHFLKNFKEHPLQFPAHFPGNYHKCLQEYLQIAKGILLTRSSDGPSGRYDSYEQL